MKDNQEPASKKSQQTEELSKNRFNKEPKLIESIRLRKAELNKQIFTCGVEFLTLVIPLSEKLNISYFGTSVGEEYKTNDSFYHFSCLKKSDIEELKDITMLENTDDQLSIIDKEYPNSKNTCDKVRKYLQEKC
ncbi:2016_t:CDS:2, partial [Rhizophagus irregularis]